MSNFNSFLMFSISGITVVIITLLAIFDKTFISFNYRIMTIVVVVLGILMCTFGRMGHVISQNPFGISVILGSILGIIALIIGILKIFNKSIPFINSEKNAFFIVVIIIVLKIIIMQIHNFMSK